MLIYNSDIICRKLSVYGVRSMETASKWQDFLKYLRLFGGLLFAEIVLEMFGYQYVGKVLFGGVWVSDTQIEHAVHLIWLLVITTPLIFALFIRQLRKETAYSKQIWNLAHYDELTGICNRRHLMKVLNAVITKAQNSQHRFAVLFIDLDRFKNINDSLGHEIGDEILKIVSQRILKSLRSDDVVARFGGDEFVVVMPTIVETSDAIQVAERILKHVQEKVVCDGYEFFLTATIGIAVYPTSGDSVTLMLKNADVAMYEAKRLGKNRWYLHLPSIQDQMYSRFQLENDLRKAIMSKQDLYLEYQPQVNVQSGLVVGTEALLRWKHPAFGIIPPMEFIPIAEETGLIVDLGKFVLQMVCDQITDWCMQGKNIVPVGVNVSQIELSEPNFKDHLISTLEAYGIPPSFICVEITETTLMKNAEHARDILKTLKNYGIRIMIDDFGQGYNSLGVLRQLPVDVMKIDCVFVRDIHTNIADMSIFSALVAVAHANDLSVIAEGVEHDEQLTILQHEQCDEYQGYLFSPPVLAEELVSRFL